MVKLPTMSAIQRAIQCVSSATLPQAQDESPKEAAERGSFIHEYIQEGVVHYAIPPHELLKFMAAKGVDAGRFADDAKAVDLEAIREYFKDVSGLLIEPAYALDAIQGSCQFLGLNIGRDYEGRGADKTRHICGSADIEGFDSTKGMRILYDLKTGKHRVAAAQGNWQLAALCVAKWCSLGRPSDFIIESGIVYTNPELTGGGIITDSVTWNAGHLSGFLLELANLTVDIQMHFQRETEGEQCRYCPAFTHCPKKLEQAATVPSSFAIELREQMQIVGPGAVLSRLKHMREVCDEVERTIRKMADQEPLDLGNGKEFGPNEYSETSIDPRIAVQLFGDSAKQAISLKLTKAGLVRALSDVMSEKDIMARLADAGGLSTQARVRYAERKKKSA